MTKLLWDDLTSRLYGFGLDRGVLYPKNTDGVVWNGLTAVNETLSGFVENEYYIDGLKYKNQKNHGSFEGIIEAFTYPEVFSEKNIFGFSYRTKVGDADNPNRGYKIHIVYNALAAPLDKLYSTINQTIEPTVMSWKVTTKPISIFGVYASSHLIIDSTIAHPWTIDAVEDILYGTADDEPSLPTPDDLLSIFEENAILRVTDNGDGSFTVEGPDEAIQMVDVDIFEVTWDSAIITGQNAYSISSL